MATQMNVIDSFRLDGKTALVTGGSKGLGKTIATALAQAGAQVAIVSRHAEESRLTAEEIADTTHKRVIFATADVTQNDQVHRMSKQVQDQLGPVDILVNNAGINTRGLAQELSEADFDAVVAINLKAPFLCSRIFGPIMCERGWGRVINMGSMLSNVAIAGRAPYCSAKAGVVSLTKVLALEWAQSGVTVNAICPGPFATEMNKPLLEDPIKYQAFVSKIPLGRWGELEEIAGVAVFLASNASSYVTGSSIVIDGGWTAQ